MENNSMESSLNSGCFQKAIALLGISADQIGTDRLETSPFANLISDDSDISIIRPVKVTFKSDAQKNEFLSLSNCQQEHLPQQVTVLSANNVVVTAGNPLVINPSGTNPVVINIDTLTLEPGGQIQCYTSVIMNVTTFIKQ